MSLNGTSSVPPFQRTGAIVIAVFALISVLALGFVVFRTIRLVIAILLGRDDNTSRSSEMLFLRTQLGHNGGCLVLSNMFISAAGLIDFSWASRAGLSRGSTCSTQAVLMHIGIWGTCWFTTTLGVHTLGSFVLRMHQARWHSLAAITIGWTVAFVAGLVPLLKNDAYGPNSTSCGITRSYSRDIFFLEALPIILSAVVSAAVYSVIFIISHGKLSTNSILNSRGLNSTNQREHGFKEHDKFIRTIIWTTFWFPLAFVLLLLPFCITRILMYAGSSVPFASSVFADVCVSLLGFVNVCLLCNTIRVIGPVYRGRSDKDETVKTFGNDASCESPIVHEIKSSPSMTSSHENSHRMFNSPKPSSNHSRDSSWSSVNSNTELLRVEKATYKSMTLKNIMPPAELSRQLGDESEPPSRLASPDPLSPRPSFATRVTGLEPSTQDRPCSFQSMADTTKRCEKELIFKSKAPPALDLPPFPISPRPLTSGNVTNKSSTLAARLGISVTSAYTPSQTAIPSTQKSNQVDAFSGVPVPRIKISAWSPENVDEFNSQPSPFSSRCSESESDFSADMMEIFEVQPEASESSDNEQDTVDSCPPSPPSMYSSQRMTMTSVWSQETGYSLGESSNAKSQETYPRVTTNLLVPGVMLGDKADVGAVMSRQCPSGPRPQTRHVASKLSASFSQMLSPKSPDNWCDVSLV